jgi:hypothetical protein
MRVWPLLLTLGACFTQPTYEDDGWTDPNGDPLGGCRKDTECPGGTVCARDGSCFAPGDVLTVHVNWTVNGMPASVETCGPAQDLSIDFSAGDFNGFGFAPVPCRAGKFTIDKLPYVYNRVQLSSNSGGAGGFFVDGMVTLDLKF